MESVEHDNQNSNPGGEPEDSLLREAIWLQFTILERSHGTLLVLIASVKRGQVKVAARQRDVEIFVILSLLSVDESFVCVYMFTCSSENVVNDNCGKVEKHA